MKKWMGWLVALILAVASFSVGSVKAQVTYQDGTYTAMATGFGGLVYVTMTMESGRIVSLKTNIDHETPGIGNIADQALTNAILMANGVEHVDVVTGATFTSRAILAAAAECVELAKKGEVPTLTPPPSATPTLAPTPIPTPGAENADYQDGLYVAQETGFGGPVVVIIMIENGKIVSLDIDASFETQQIGTDAAEKLTDAILSANGVENVDVVAGATLTSRAVIAAATACFEASCTGAVSTCTPLPTSTPTPTPTMKPGVTQAYQDGTYTAQALGFSGPVHVSITTENGWIMAVDIQAVHDALFADLAVEPLTNAILQANGVDGVDTVSRATITSRAILAAAAECIRLSQQGTGLPGDVDGSAGVMLADALAIFLYCTEERGDINLQLADVTGDGVVNLYDALRILQHGAGWDVPLR